MIVNPDKHHAMVLGTTDHRFSFPGEESLDLLGMAIDNQLNFDKHISPVCNKVNNQLKIRKDGIFSMSRAWDEEKI